MWRKCKNLSKDSSYTATVQSEPQFAPGCHMPQSIPSAFFPCSGTQAAANLMLLCCHRRVGAVWRIIFLGSLLSGFVELRIHQPRCLQQTPASCCHQRTRQQCGCTQNDVCICDALNVTVQIVMGKGNLQEWGAAAKAEDRKVWSGTAEKRWVDWVWDVGAENIRSWKGWWRKEADNS